MSLKWALSREVPSDTAAIGHVVLKADNVYRQIGDRFDELFPPESEFAFMYEVTGRGAISPLLAALVTVFQMMEKVADRAAAEFVASRIDWKYALHLPLGYAGFHWTDLLAFRTRLREHDQERLLFDRILVKLREQGLIKTRGKMRTDSTHVLAVIERLSQLELVCESIRLALQAVTECLPDWVETTLPPSLEERYSQRQSEYGLSQAQVRKQLVQAGQEGFWFLAQLERSAPDAVRQLPEVVTLRTVLEQQFPQGPSEPPAERRPTGQGVIESPHEPEARFSAKRGKGWIGYKVQVTETCDVDHPHLIVDLEPTSALDNDAPQLGHIQDRLQARDLLPAEQQVDQGYMSGENLVESGDLGINLMGIPLDDTQGPAGFQQTDFSIDVQARQAVCPAGHSSRVWSEKHHPKGGPPQILIRFAGATCQACPSFGRCTLSPQGRSLTLHPYRTALLARRVEAKTPDFREKLHLRAGIEAAISELTRRYGLRQARYRRLFKQRLQSYFTAVAVNLKRLARWWAQSTAIRVAEPAS
jgi:IS5 family transposase